MLDLLNLNFVIFQENPALVHLFTDAALLERSRLNTIRFSIHPISGRLVTSWTSTPTGPCISYMGHITKYYNHVIEIRL